jgi:Zn-dependent protease
MFSRLREPLRIPGIRPFGAEIRLHWSALLLVAIIVLLSIRSPLIAIISTLAYLSMILLHECGHAFLAARRGYRVYRIELGAFHGICCYESHGRERDEALIAWGGAAAQIAVAIPIIVLYEMTSIGDIALMKPFVVFLGYISLLVAIVNLAPSWMVDGGKAWKIIPILWRERKRRGEPRYDPKANHASNDNVVRGPWKR